MNTYSPIKLGKTGKEVHAGEATVTGTRHIGGKEVEIKTYRSICSVVNSHRINNHPAAMALPEGTPVTCKKCLDRMKRQEPPTESVAYLRTPDGAYIQVAKVPTWVLEYAAYRREGGTQPIEEWLPEHGYAEALKGILAERDFG